MERAGTNLPHVLALLLGCCLLLGIALPLTLRAEFGIEDKLRTQVRKNRETDPVVKPQRENTFKGKSSHAADPAVTEILIRCSQAGACFTVLSPPDPAISPALRQGGCKKWYLGPSITSAFPPGPLAASLKRKHQDGEEGFINFTGIL